MEVGLSPEMPTYSGGLGVLAGDTIKAAADLGLPFVAVSLISRRGYFRQVLGEDGAQAEEPSSWDPSLFMELQTPRVSVRIEGREVSVCSWRYEQRSAFGRSVPVIFLDTDLAANAPEDREITHYLYGGDDTYRLKAEIVLGIGGLRMLEALGFHVARYHLNEGHAALLTLELLHRTKKSIENVWDERLIWDLPAVREKTIFTTHTPVAAGHDRFPYDLVARVLGDYVPLELLRKLAGEESMNNTLLAMNLSGFINGVAKKHRDVSRSMFQGYAISAVTNGVHSVSWTHPAMAALFDRHIPAWREDPTLLAWVDKIPDSKILETHRLVKRELVELIRQSTGVRFDEDVLTIGFARRATGYKRADLLFSDPELLRRIGAGKLQIVFAGKAHPRDQEGKELIRRVHQRMAELEGTIPAVWLPDYDMRLALQADRRGGRVAQHPAAPAGGLRDQRHESSPQRRAQLQRPGRLVDRGAHRGADRLVDRPCPRRDRHGRAGRLRRGRRRRPLPKAGEQDHSPLHGRFARLGPGDEGCHRQERLLLQRPPDDEPLRHRSLPGERTLDHRRGSCYTPRPSSPDRRRHQGGSHVRDIGHSQGTEDPDRR